MRDFIVTYCLKERHRSHDPKNKQRGMCPLNGVGCSDVTGQHHSTLVRAENESDAEQLALLITGPSSPWRITRIEEVDGF